MLTFRRSTWVFLLLAAILLFGIIKYLVPAITPAPQPKPEPIVEERVYEYYILIDEATGEVLGHVSSVKVTTGDEYVSGQNKRYVVTKVEENRAYLQDFGRAGSGKDKKQFKDKTN